MDVLIEAGGQTHRLPQDAATLLAENLRSLTSADPYHADALRSAADRIERALVADDSSPMVFDDSEVPHVAKVLDALSAGPHETPDLAALFWALNGGVGPSRW